MSKLPRLTAKDLMRILEKRDFFLVRQSGSHMIYRDAKGIRATVPFHGSKIIHPKITKRILEDLQLTEQELQFLL